jgi:hypothetical protein
MWSTTRRELTALRQDVARILAAVEIIKSNQEQIMASLDDILADVTAESTAINSVGVLIGGLKQQLADALAGTKLPPATQAKVDAIFTQAETNKAAIAAAIASGTTTAGTTSTTGP